VSKITVKLTDTTAGVTRIHRVEAQPSEPFTTTACRLVARVYDLPRNRSLGITSEALDAYGQPFLDVTAAGRTFRVAKVAR
jgi:hypothetical protein